MVMQSRYVFPIFATALIILSGAALGNENAEAVYEGSLGEWVMNTIRDTFDESVLAWKIFTHGQKSDESLSEPTVSLVCTSDYINLEARTGDLFTKSLGSMWAQDEPIKVKIKIDDFPVQEFYGEYPNTLLKTEFVFPVIEKMTKGKIMKIRTEHNTEASVEAHTFIISLIGFVQAYDWLSQNCTLEAKNKVIIPVLETT